MSVLLTVNDVLGFANHYRVSGRLPRVVIAQQDLNRIRKDLGGDAWSRGESDGR